MNTEWLVVSKHVDNDEIYQQVVDSLLSGEVVAFPTETVYGLGAIATNEDAVQKIFQVKGRPADNPLIVHIASHEQVSRFVETIPPLATQLMENFWPGPLTLVFKRKPSVLAPSVTPNVETVGLRVPDHPVALRLLTQLDEPVAAPSANKSGRPSPTIAAHVYEDLQEIIPFILDGGQTGLGVESTVLDVTTTPPTLLRPGGVTKEQIEEVIGAIQLPNEQVSTAAPRSPGTKYKHYAPEAPLFLLPPDEQLLKQAIEQAMANGERVAVIGPDEYRTTQAEWYFSMGSIHRPEELAYNLYNALRACNHTFATIILAIEASTEGVGEAFMNRLSKAAEGKNYSGK